MTHDNLTDYIYDAVDQGVPESEVRRSLISAGWSPEELDDAWREITHEMDRSLYTSLLSNFRSNVRRKIIEAVAVVLLLAATLLVTLIR
jgi:hypothetical protein